jgi:hypothetical protein
MDAAARFGTQAKGAGPKRKARAQDLASRPYIAPAPLVSLLAGYSKIRIAAAIVVVHKPRLSPIADCVTFAVRTILFEMR